MNRAGCEQGWVLTGLGLKSEDMADFKGVKMLLSREQQMCGESWGGDLISGCVGQGIIKCGCVGGRARGR